MKKMADAINKDDCKREFNIPLDKISVHIGYNGSTIQQHLLILEKLALLAPEIKKILYITIPCGYGITPGYPAQIEQALINCGIEGSLQKEYLDKTHTAHLRNSADIFIYGNETDSKSDSPIEYMYLGAYVLMPEWLLPNYQVLNKTTYTYYSYNSFELLTPTFNSLLNDFEQSDNSSPNGLQDFQNWMEKDNSWDVLGPLWKKLL